MLHIIIDGYNYINRIHTSRTGDVFYLETLRKEFLEELTLYRRKRKADITVVFDAYRSNSFNRQRDMYKGINIVYSRASETADDIIIEYIRKKRAGTVIVSSDRAIVDEAKRCGIPFITPLRLKEAMRSEEKSEEERTRIIKGNPRRLPKKLRKSIRTIEKI